MAKYYIRVEWAQVMRRWAWDVQAEDQMIAFGSAPFRWLAKRRALSALMDIKAAQDEAERNKDRALSYEVDI